MLTGGKLMRKREIPTMDVSLLKPFHGYQTSIIPVSSGYYFYLASWDRTPTQFPRFSNVWIVTPEDKRILFSDPRATSEIVCIYHEFHEIYGASIGIDWVAENQLYCRCKSLDDAYDLKVEFHVHESMASRLLLAIGSGPPTQLRMSRPIAAVSNFLVNLLVARGGSVLVGKTETGQPFYHGETERLFHVAGGSISLNGKDLGTFTSPTWSVEFGDAVPFARPVVKLGTLYIPFEQDMVDDSA
jgi:hypothetical protein